MILKLLKGSVKYTNESKLRFSRLLFPYSNNLYPIGEGAYSSVYYVRRIVDGDYYALKKVRMQKLSDKEKENALNEVRILASIRHTNIIAYKEAFIDDASQSLW